MAKQSCNNQKLNLDYWTCPKIVFFSSFSGSKPYQHKLRSKLINYFQKSSTSLGTLLEGVVNNFVNWSYCTVQYVGKRHHILLHNLSSHTPIQTLYVPQNHCYWTPIKTRTIFWIFWSRAFRISTSILVLLLQVLGPTLVPGKRGNRFEVFSLNAGTQFLGKTQHVKVIIQTQIT